MTRRNRGDFNVRDMIGSERVTYAVNHKTLAFWLGYKAVTIRKAVAKELAILRRVLGVIFESRETQADREIAPFVAGSGGTCTDGIEREIMHRTSPRSSTFAG
jgi:hypothetical protein